MSRRACGEGQQNQCESEGVRRGAAKSVWVVSSLCGLWTCDQWAEGGGSKLVKCVVLQQARVY